MYQDIPEVTRKRVIDMYQAGERVKDITAETSLSRPTIFWILRVAGIKPDRLPRADQLSLAEVLEMLRESEREVGRLRSEVERLQAEVDRLQQ